MNEKPETINAKLYRKPKRFFGNSGTVRPEPSGSALKPGGNKWKIA